MKCVLVRCELFVAHVAQVLGERRKELLNAGVEVGGGARGGDDVDRVSHSAWGVGGRQRGALYNVFGLILIVILIYNTY